MLKKKRRVKYFDIDGELLLDFIKQLSRDIPKDAILAKLMDLNSDPFSDPYFKKMRFFIESESYPELPEGCIPEGIRPDPICSWSNLPDNIKKSFKGGE